MLWVLFCLLLVLVPFIPWLPRGWRLVAGLAVVQGLAVILVAGARGDERDILAVLAAVPLALAWAAGVLSRRHWRRLEGAPQDSSPASPRVLQLAVCQALSLPSAWIVWQAFEALGRRSDSPTRGHEIAVAAAVALLALAVLALRRQSPAPYWPWVAAPLVAAAAIGGWASWQALAMMRGAEQVADGQPFCIQVPQARDRYRPARSMGDLSAFVALERGQNHAVLAAGPPGQLRFFHWSHRDGRFLPGGTPVLHCRPDPQFTTALGLLPGPAAAPPDESHLFAVLEGRPFLVPRAYRPSSLGSTRQLRLHAEAPGFAPGTAVVEMDMVGFCEPIEPRVYRGRCLWIDATTPYVQASAGAGAHGLSRQAVTAGTSQLTQWFERDGQGRVTTKITCPSSGSPCSQEFQAAGMTLTFTHAAELVPRWREMQAALLVRVREFERGGALEQARLQAGR